MGEMVDRNILQNSNAESNVARQSAQRNLGCCLLAFGIVCIPFAIYFFYPTAWLIPEEPMVRPGVMFGEIEPRWRLIERRGSRAVPALAFAATNGKTKYTRDRSLIELLKIGTPESIAVADRIFRADPSQRWIYDEISYYCGSDHANNLLLDLMDENDREARKYKDVFAKMNSSNSSKLKPKINIEDDR